jgi:hypothetical protein
MFFLFSSLLEIYMTFGQYYQSNIFLVASTIFLTPGSNPGIAGPAVK